MSEPIAAGEILAGKYRVERVLGQGGMGVVVSATHLHLQQKVAIKLLLEEVTPEVMARFLREARASALLKSEHVVRVLDVGELPSGRPYMVMEQLEGCDLAELLQKRGRLDPGEAADYLLQAGEALAEAHAAGIVHRDLKPGNLFVTRDADGAPFVKVLDFGISKETSVDPHQPKLTSSQTVFGSPAYMAPEQMMASRDVDARADIWSLGIIFYELLAGKTPFDGASYAELVIMVNATDPAPLAEVRRDVPKAVEAAILRCLNRDRARRFGSIAELSAVLAPFAGAAGKRSAERIARRAPAPGLSMPPPASSMGRVDAGTRDRLSLALSRSTSAPPQSRLPLVGGLIAGVIFTGVAAIGALGWFSRAPSVGADAAPSAVAAPSSTSASTSTVAEATVAPGETIAVALDPPPIAPLRASPPIPASSPRALPSARPLETAAPKPVVTAPPADPPKKNQLDMPIK
ncbi:MAG: protein kinase [Minicystis sp.]